MSWSTYDAWKTDPEYGLSHRDLREREKRIEEWEGRLDRCDALRATIREEFSKIDFDRLEAALTELEGLDGCLPGYEDECSGYRFRTTGPDEISVQMLRAAATDDPTCREADSESFGECGA